MWSVSEDERHALEASWMAFAIKRANMDEVAAWWREIDQRHSEPHRHYHTLGHVRDMLQLVSGEAPIAATWFHDIVYEPARTDNEDASARIAAVALREVGFSIMTVDLVIRMIRATTDHDPKDLPPQARLFFDADLAILGTSREHYAEYCGAIRREYAHLSDAEFREHRNAVLDRLRSRPHIYFTESMRDRFEQQARANIEWETRSAGKPGGEEAESMRAT
jgi:predicted metal-dependent HD superfamily phosphohydrolase